MKIQDKSEEPKKKSMRGRGPSFIGKRKEATDFYHQILSAWWEDNALNSLGIREITDHINTNFLNKQGSKISEDAVRERVKKLVKEGELTKSKDGGFLKNRHFDNGDLYDPALIIRDKDFSNFHSIFLNPNQVLFFYHCPRLAKTDGMSLNLIPEIKILGDNIQKAVEDFQKKTGVPPRLVAFTTNHISNVVSYTKSKLEYEFAITLVKKIDKFSLRQLELVNEAWGEEMNKILIKILKKLEIEFHSRRNDIPNKERVINDLRLAGELIVPLLALYHTEFDIDKLDSLIKKEVKKYITKMTS